MVVVLLSVTHREQQNNVHFTILFKTPKFFFRTSDLAPPQWSLLRVLVRRYVCSCVTRVCRADHTALTTTDGVEYNFPRFAAGLSRPASEVACYDRLPFD